MRVFDKPPKTFAEQLEILKSRGMAVADEKKAIFRLSQVNYYRLGAYWLPFEQTHLPHCFKPNTQFEQVWELYAFDRELRLMVLDAIERIEVAIRTRFAYEFAHRHGAHGYMSQQYFKNELAWKKLIKNLQSEIDRADEVFIDHYKNNYHQPNMPPVWVVCEVMSFGQLSKWYQLLAPKKTRSEISAHFDCDEKQFEGLLHHLVYLRNVSAHHSRLWNRKFTKTIAKPQNKPFGIAQQCNFDEATSANRKLYNSLVFLLYFLDKIAPNHSWRSRLVRLLNKYPHIQKSFMGFPTQWESYPIWQQN